MFWRVGGECGYSVERMWGYCVNIVGGGVGSVLARLWI